MPDPANATQMASDILTQIGLVFATPALLGVVLVAIVVTFAITRWATNTQVTNAQSQENTAKSRADFWKERYELEERQHQALKASVAEDKGLLAAQVQELRTGTKEFRDLVINLGLGGQVHTPINPTDDPLNWPSGVSLDANVLRDWAALANTAASGFATTKKAPDGTFVTSGTPTAVSTSASFTSSSEFVREREPR